MTDAGWTRCAECGMSCNADEYHPYAACLMFTQCHNSETVRINLEAVRSATYQQGRVAGLMEAAIICRERGKPHDIEWWNTVSKKEISRQTAIDCAELIEQRAQGGAT